MKRRILDFLFLFTFLVGLVFAWRSGQQRTTLAREHERISRLTGVLPITDPAKVHIRAIETGDPLHFAWRVYFPPNYRQTIHFGTGGEGTSWSSQSEDFIARVRFREDENQQLNVYTRFSGGSSRMTYADQSLSTFLERRWNELVVEQLGKNEMAVLGANQSAKVLRLSMPELMEKEAREKLPDYVVENYVPVVYEVGLGTKP